MRSSSLSQSLSHILFPLFLLPTLSSLPFINCQPLTLPSLNYSYNALSPLFTEHLLRVHHLKHHSTYTTKLNEALIVLREKGGKSKELVKLGVDELLTRLNDIEDEELRTKIRRNGGGFLNHEMFFSTLKPFNYSVTNAKTTDDSSTALSVPVVDSSSIPLPTPILPTPSSSSRFTTAFLSAFTSFSNFQSLFTTTSLNLFGSGWSWLYIEGGNNYLEGKLRIGTTPNQDVISADKSGNVGVLILDLWEHSYYLDYENRKDEYIKQWWFSINWEKVEELYEEEMNKRQQKAGKAEL